MTPYPASLPLDDIIEVVRDMIVNRTLDVDDAKLAHEAWQSVGYGLRIAVGELPGAPTPPDVVPFPTILPTEEIMVVIAAIRAQKKPNAEIAKALWEVVGYGLFKKFGEDNHQNVVPAPPPHSDPIPPPQPGVVVVKSEAPLPDDEFFANQLELAINHPSGRVCGAIPIPWTLIIKWGLALLVKVL
jgi:hypothetical protein